MFCSNTTSAPPPHTAIQSACRTTAPAAPIRPAPCSCETDGVTAITMPDINNIKGQYRLPPSVIPARSVALTRPAMIASATPIPICASCVMMMGTASTPSVRNSASAGERGMKIPELSEWRRIISRTHATRLLRWGGRMSDRSNVSLGRPGRALGKERGDRQGVPGSVWKSRSGSIDRVNRCADPPPTTGLSGAQSGCRGGP